MESAQFDQLTLAQATQFLSAGRQQIDGGSTRFDLANLKSVDSSALACLLALARHSDPCEFVNPPQSLLNLAKLYGVDDILF